MTFVDDYEVKEVACKLSVETRPSFIPRDGLISREVNVPSVTYGSETEFPSRVSEWSKGLVFGIID